MTIPYIEFDCEFTLLTYSYSYWQWLRS